jgi:hypothetical protein
MFQLPEDTDSALKVEMFKSLKCMFKKIIMSNTKKYFIATRPQTNEYHSVHKEDCPFLPEEGKRKSLGSFERPGEALSEGKKHFKQSKCCLFCSGEYSPENRIYEEPVFLHSEKLVVSEVFQFCRESALFCAVN